MLERLLPAHADNRYPGLRFGAWPLAVVILFWVARGCTHVFRADGGAQSVSTIPLDAFGPGGAATVIGLFARWGVTQIALALVLLVILVRYRALVPLAYLALLLEYAAGRAVAAVKPIVMTGVSPAATMNTVLAGLSALGLILSLLGSGRRDAPQTPL